MAVHLFAAIDIGSFELELAIFEVLSKGEIRRVDLLRHVIPLGSDTFATGKISYELVEEMCEVLNDFVEVAKSYHVDEIRVYATSAMREASNRLMVEDQIRIRCGLDVHVLSNSEQRFLCYKAIPVWDKQFYKIIEKESAIIDVGYGSMQISLYGKGSLQCTQNISVGALRLEATLKKLENTGKDFLALSEELVDNELDSFKNYFLRDKSIKNIIAIGDCMRLFAAKVMHLSRSESVPTEEFIRVYNEVKGKNANDLSLEYDIPASFADLILPVAMIYYRAVCATEAQSILIPGTSLTEGIAAEWAEEKKMIRLERDFSEDILSEARHINKRYCGNKSHVQLIVDLSTKIYDAMKKYHGMGKRERLLLQLAAILHDCGKYISMNAPGQCSYEIIMGSEIIGISHREREIVANIVRFNTMDLSQEMFERSSLTTEDYRIIYKLTAILRIANALDRSHKQKFADCSVAIRNGNLIIQVNSSQDMTLEKGLFEEKARFFEEIFGVLPEIKQRKKER